MIVEKYGSQITGKQFWKTWVNFLIGENLRVAFGKYREFTDCLRDSLNYSFKYHDISGDPADVHFMLDLWDEVRPFPDVLPSFYEQQKHVKVIIYSNDD